MAVPYDSGLASVQAPELYPRELYPRMTPAELESVAQRRSALAQKAGQYVRKEGARGAANVREVGRALKRDIGQPVGAFFSGLGAGLSDVQAPGDSPASRLGGPAAPGAAPASARGVGVLRDVQPPGGQRPQMFGVTMDYGGGGQTSAATRSARAANQAPAQQPGGLPAPSAVADSLRGVEATAGAPAPVPGLSGVSYAGNYGRTPAFRRDTTNAAGERLAEFSDIQGLQQSGVVGGDAADAALAAELLADVNPQRTAQNIVPAGSLAAVPGATSEALSRGRQEALARGDVTAAERSLMTSAERDAMDRQAKAYRADPLEAYKTDALANVQAVSADQKAARQAMVDQREAARDQRATATERRRSTAARQSGIVQAVQLAERLGGTDLQLGTFAAQLVPYIAQQSDEWRGGADLASAALAQARQYREAGISSIEELEAAQGQGAPEPVE